MPKRAHLPVEGAKSTLRVVVARGIANALITGFDEAAEEGRPLTQRQRQDMATMAIMVYADAVKAGENSLVGPS